MAGDTKQLIISIVLPLIISGFCIFLFQQYIIRRWGPLTAEETLRRENFLKSKEETYFQAMELASRYFSNTTLTEGSLVADTLDRPLKGLGFPTESEVNTCYAKLSVYANDVNIIKSFQNIFVSNSEIHYPLQAYIEFLKLIRTELGQTSEMIKAEDYKIILFPDKK